MIYFVRSVDGGPVKIGTTCQLTVRLKTLSDQYRQNFRVLAVMDGSFAEEKEVHKRFSHIRINESEEWFDATDELSDFILKEGHTWDGNDENPPTNIVPVRVSEEAIKWARIASGYTGESVSEYLSRIAIERGQHDADQLHAKVRGEKPKR